MAENISVTLTVWKPFFVFVSHVSRGISGARSLSALFNVAHSCLITCNRMEKAEN